jgi:DNA-binding GntR family transcriptional regulator
VKLLGEATNQSGLVARKSLSDAVYDALIGQIMEGNFPPETALNIDALVRSFGVSHTPIREALARLEATGLVTRAALKGYRVAPFLNPDELDDLMDARAAIEPTNAFIATSKARKEELDELANTVQIMKQSPTGGSYKDIADFWDADELFHRIIAEMTDNTFLISAYNTLGGHVQRFRLFAGKGINDADSAIQEHEAVLDSMLLGDALQAEELMKLHIRKVKARAHADREALYLRSADVQD